ncbi:MULTISPECIES: T7SS effector LXG polymorphic toxin [Priestia]|uniref:T7SS effector LXG polymorphic toxin n=1 Tax=Priestia TaxID=2800373 RepID=UPI000815C431|nr:MULTISPECIES: T7SS effector LXG polymorphic toxin [Priestia]SCC51341.1 LXG domain of WXG superfamily protein [Priestia flexa]
MQNAVYDASALLETAKERISSYNEMEKQLLVLQKAFKRIAALDEDLQGKGADNIKAFYQSHADIANQWLNLIETNRAFFETIEAKMGTSELEGSTFVAEAFLDQNVHQGNTQAKEMIIQQQNALQDIFNTIDHILPLNVFSSAKYNQYLEEAEQERKDTLQAVNQLDADLVQEYKGLSFFYNMVTQNIQAVTSSTSQAGNATPLYFDLDAYKASPVYGMQGEANSRAVSYVEAKEAERKAYENQKNIQAQESFTLEVCENPHAKKKEEKGFWGAAWGSVTSGVEHAWDKTMDGFHAGVDKVTHGTEAAWTATKTGWNTGVQAVSDGVKELKHTAHETWADVQSQAAAGLAKAKVSTKLAIEVSKESWKVSIENIKQGTKTALDVTKRSWDGVAGGATDAVVDTWNDLVHMVQHPVETAESIGEGVKAVWDDPKGVANTIGNEIKDSWNEQVINGDTKSRGHYFSYLTANVAMSIVGTKGADKLAKTTKLEQLSGAATKKLNEGAAAIHVRTQSALQNLGLDNRLAYPGVGSVKGNGGYQFIERVDGGNGVGTKVRDESGKGEVDNKAEEMIQTVEEARLQQRTVIESVENGEVILKTTKHKGNYGEIKMDDFFESQTYTRISDDRVLTLDQKIVKGVDGVYENASPPPKYVIAEAKYNTSRLGKTNDGKQMSEDWIFGSERLDSTLSKEKADKIVTEMLLNPENVQRIVIQVMPDGTVVKKILEE